jgi:alcohol-forming fatty acyl-CoA reductase
MAAIITNVPMRMQFSSHLPDPSAATVDEAPVDTVVNRLIVHVAFESTGCVHAVGGSMGRRYTEEWFGAAVELRRRWWGHPKLVWCDDHWKADRLCIPAKLFVIMGCSFIFDEAKTDVIWDRMSLSARSTWPLWKCKNISTTELVAGREKAITFLIGRFLSRVYGLPTSLTLCLYRPSKMKRHSLKGIKSSLEAPCKDM